MRDNTFTPGPWVADDYMSGHDGIYIRSKSRHWSMAAVHATDGCTDPSRDVSELEAAANARLIAAAPDMYDALWETIELSDRTLPPSGRTPECQRVYDIVREALRKAEGE